MNNERKQPAWSTDTLMENAGLAVAQEIWMQLGSLEDRRIAVLVGPGNNGGDGLVAARHLHEWGAQVRVYALREREDPQWTQTLELGVPCGTVAEDENFEALEGLLAGAEAIVDALLGTGSSRADFRRPGRNHGAAGGGPIEDGQTKARRG